MGIDKRKGSIALGKDADLAILDPTKKTVFGEAQDETKVKSKRV